MQSTSDQFKAQVAGNDVMLEHQVKLTLPIERTNLFPTPNGDHGQGDWLGTANPGSAPPTFAASDTVAARVGTKALTITWGGAAAGEAAAYLYVPTKIGALYTITLWVWNEPSSPTIVMTTNSGTVSTVDLPDPTDGTFTKHCFHVTADSTFTALEIVPVVHDTLGGEQTVLGAVMWEEGGLVDLAPFAGDDPNASWTKLPGRSPSVLNVDPYPDVTWSVESFTVDRQLTSDMPDGTRLLAGYPAAQATVVLSGMVDPLDASKDAAWLFDPWATDSPLYGIDPSGSPITVHVGVYTEPGKPAELLQVFTGEVDETLVDHVAGTVTLTCIDTRNQLRGPGSLPPIATRVTAGYGYQFVPGLTPTFAIDYLLRASGVHSGPPPRPQCKFYVSNHGSTWAEIGGPHVSVQQIYEGDPIYDPVPGKWFPQVQPTGYVDSYYDNSWPAVSDGLVFEWWQQFKLTNPAIGTYSHVVISAASTYCHLDEDPATHALSFNIGNGSGSVTVPLGISGEDLTWRQVTLSLRNESPNCGYTVWVDGAQVATGSFAGFDNLNLSDMNVQWQSPLECFQIAQDPNPTPFDAAAFTPAAVFDESLNTDVTVMPDTSGMDPWQVIQQVCDAEQAVAGFDETGVFRFRNRRTIRGGASVRKVTSKQSLKSLQSRLSKSTVATRVQVPINAVQVQPEGLIWSASTVYAVGSYKTLTLTISLDNPAVNARLESADIGEIPTGGVPSDGTAPRSGFRACTKPDGKGISLPQMMMTGHQESISKIVLSIYNPYPVTAYLVTPVGYGFPTASEGQPALQVNGYPVVAAGQAVDGSQSTSAATVADEQWPPESIGGAKSTRYGEILLTLQSNPWVQSIDPATDLCTDLLADLWQARPLLEQVDVVPDPSLQLADRITLDDSDGSRMLDDAMITGVTLAGGKSSWSMQLNLRSVAPPRGWVMGVQGRSELGVTTYV